MNALIPFLLDANIASEVGNNLIQGNWVWLGVGIALIIATILVIHFVKQVIGNIVGGLIAWGIVTWVFGIALPFGPTLIVTILFGMGGVGVMIVLKVLGVL